jgi:hypothetical protein
MVDLAVVRRAWIFQDPHRCGWRVLFPLEKIPCVPAEKPVCEETGDFGKTAQGAPAHSGPAALAASLGRWVFPQARQLLVSDREQRFRALKTRRGK